MFPSHHPPLKSQSMVMKTAFLELHPDLLTFTQLF
jgi:hypothetical protein